MNSMQQPKHHRHSIRLEGYDYHLPGAYFITLVTAGRMTLFGEIQQGKPYLSTAGYIVQQVWQELPNHYRNIRLGNFCTMPNHFHGIIQILEESTPGLLEIVRWFKTFSARRINSRLGSKGRTIWQRNYYEHIIRNQIEWEQIVLYILANPAQWENDPENV